MKITALTENTSHSPEIGCEHGLSLYIETENHKILFDMGQTDLFSRNAEKLGVDPASVEFAVISHGHYDHGGGLKKFLEVNSSAPVYLSRFAFERHYNGTEKYIGLDQSLSESPRLVFTGEEYKIADGLTLYACNLRHKIIDFGAGGLNVAGHGRLYPDDFRHEHYLLIEEGGKRVLISGCSHKGILNIMEWFKPDFLIGGFHFMKLDCGETLKAYAEMLDSRNAEYYTCHCTGERQFEFMKQFSKHLHYISAGETIII